MKKYIYKTRDWNIGVKVLVVGSWQTPMSLWCVGWWRRMARGGDGIYPGLYHGYTY